jgi:hypothetical protein
VIGVSTVRVEPDETSAEATFTSTRRLDYAPGILLLIAVGVLGKYAQIWWNTMARHHHWTVPDIEYVLWAIVIGLLITNTIGLHPIFRPGVLTYQFWLKVGIVALGTRFVLGDIAKLGGTSLIQILVDMAIAGSIILIVARAFGLSGKLGSLLAIGTSICGVSAIVAAKGAIRARNADVSYAIAASSDPGEQQTEHRGGENEACCRDDSTSGTYGVYDAGAHAERRLVTQPRSEQHVVIRTHGDQHDEGQFRYAPMQFLPLHTPNPQHLFLADPGDLTCAERWNAPSARRDSCLATRKPGALRTSRQGTARRPPQRVQRVPTRRCQKRAARRVIQRRRRAGG